MQHHEFEALLHGALDNTLTPEERATLRRMLAGSAEGRERAANLEQLSRMIESLGPADAPPTLVHDVLAQISNSTRQAPVLQFPPSPLVPKRGVTVNKKIIFGLAAAAAVVLAVITYTSYPPATEGTEATIGAAQRAQAPQIAAKDVGLGDTSAQDVLQSETWDAIMKDEDLRSTLQDAEVRRMLEDSELRDALRGEAVRNAMRDTEFASTLKKSLSSRSGLTQAEASAIRNPMVREALSNKAFDRALRTNSRFAEVLLSAKGSRALSGGAMLKTLNDRNFAAALRSGGFERQLMNSKKIY